MMRNAKPVVDVGIVRKWMRGFAEVFRASQSSFEVALGRCWIALGYRDAPESEAGPNVLRENEAFAPLPRLEATRPQKVK